MPKVAIGLPTRNGGPYLLECLQCLQNQTFTDFEVLISDNHSDDETSAICQKVADRDNRFKYSRPNEPIGAMENFERVKSLASAPYFMWRADDDLSDPNYLEGLVRGLDHTNARMAVGPICRLTFAPNPKESFYDLPTDLSDLSPASRVAQTLQACRPSWFYGLWRRDHLESDWEYMRENYPYVWAMDHLTMLPAILNDAVVAVPGARFIQRIYRVSNYSLPPTELLRARLKYATLAFKLLRSANFAPDEDRLLRKALQRHMDQRVAPVTRTAFRAAKWFVTGRRR